MSEEAIKREVNSAVKSAIKILSRPKGSHKIIILDGNPFHIEDIRQKEIRRIRIVLNEIGEDDIKIVEDFQLPDVIFTKVIWCKKPGKLNFIEKEIN